MPEYVWVLVKGFSYEGIQSVMEVFETKDSALKEQSERETFKDSGDWFELHKVKVTK